MNLYEFIFLVVGIDSLVSILNMVNFHLNNVPDNFMNYMYATNDQWTIKIVLMLLYLKRSVKIRF